MTVLQLLQFLLTVQVAHISVFVSANFVIDGRPAKVGFIPSVTLILYPLYLTKQNSTSGKEGSMGRVEVYKGMVVEQRWVSGWIVEEL